MWNFVTSFIASFKIMAMSVRSISSLRRLRWARHVPGVRAFANITHNWGRLLWFLIRAEITLMVIFSGFMFILYGIHSYFGDAPQYHSFLDSINLSWDKVQTFAAWCFTFSLGWTLVVFCNHAADIVSLVIQHGESGFVSSLGAIVAFLWVTNVSMWCNFFEIIFTNPSLLFTSLPTIEFRLLLDTFTYLPTVGWNWLTNHTSDLLSPVMGLIGSFVRDCYYQSIDFIGGLITSSWSWLTVSIASYITPNVPSFMQPAVDKVFQSIATGIAISLVWWILRTFLGFPF